MIGKICGTGSYIPEHYLDNHDLAQLVETNDEWIRERTGIVRRHVIEEDTTVSMSVKASERAMENAGVTPEEIDLIIVSTVSPESMLPCTACEVQSAIGAVNAFCFDLNAACTGFLFAYNTAQAYIAAGMCKTALIIGAESLSNLVNWEDRGTCILFGDGAGAAILRAEEGKGYASLSHSDGTKGEALICRSRHRKGWDAEDGAQEAFIQMKGQDVFRFAVKKVPEVIQEVLNQENLTVDDIDYFILHQANMRIVEGVARRLKVDIAKCPMNLQEYGNTSSASIPILLDEMNQKQQLKKGQRVVMAGFGAGLSWGATILEW